MFHLSQSLDETVYAFIVEDCDSSLKMVNIWLGLGMSSTVLIVMILVLVQLRIQKWVEQTLALITRLREQEAQEEISNIEEVIENLNSQNEDFFFYSTKLKQSKHKGQ